MTTVRKVSSAFMVVLFLLAAAVQFNDPDPLVWIAIYTVAATVTFWSIGAAEATQKRGLRASVPALATTAALSGAAYLSTKVFGLQPLFDSEEGREMMGLMIVAVWFAIVTLWLRGKPRPKIDDLM